jgi:peptidoglycan/xylan/chitin deacetylase (PgdA/CDA1 family)
MENNEYEELSAAEMTNIIVPVASQLKFPATDSTQRIGLLLKQYLIVLIAIVTVSTGVCGATSLSDTQSGPDEVLRKFYKAIGSNNCSRALELRPDYPRERCQAIESAKINRIKIIDVKERIALVYIDVSYRLQSKDKRWEGHTMLVHNGERWVIQANDFWWEQKKFTLRDCQARVAKYQLEGPRRLEVSGLQAQPLATRPVTASVSASADEAPEFTGASDHASPQKDSSATEVPTENSRPEGIDEFGREIVQTPMHVNPAIEGFASGSKNILHKLWTEKQLKGSPDEKKIVKTQKDLSPPLRQSPKFQNQPLGRDLCNSIRRVKPFEGRKVIALTFDLCETANDIAGYDAAIVNYLRDNGIKATFFAGGKWMRSHQEKTQQLMVDPLFEVGNHSWSHANLRLATEKEIANEILWTQAQYELLWEDLERQCKRVGIDSEMSNIPKVPIVFRFPFGTCNSLSLKKLNNFGLAAIQWDVVTGDPAAGQTADNITRTVLAETKPGSIIICHANGRGHGTAEALPRVIPALRNKGFEFVTVSELLRLGQVEAHEECFELRPGDNSRYDRVR